MLKCKKHAQPEKPAKISFVLGSVRNLLTAGCTTAGAVRTGRIGYALVIAISAIFLWPQSSPAQTADARLDRFNEIVATGSAHQLAELVMEGRAPQDLPEEARLAARLRLVEGLLLTGQGGEASAKPLVDALTRLFPDDPTVGRIAARHRERTAEMLVLGQNATVSLVENTVSEDFFAAVEKEDAPALIEMLRTDGLPPDLPSDTRTAAEALILAFVRPLPASDSISNRNGYQALSVLDPENATYRGKAARYAAAVGQGEPAPEAGAASILDRIRTERDTFNAATFYVHPSKPASGAERSYVQTYVAQTAEGNVFLRFRLNYMAESWLFVTSARFRIDGEIVEFPGNPVWNHDNRSRVWEWIDVVADRKIRELARRIADSEETVIRFDGRQAYDNITVGEADKQAIIEMFEVEKALRNGDAG